MSQIKYMHIKTKKFNFLHIRFSEMKSMIASPACGIGKLAPWMRGLYICGKNLAVCIRNFENAYSFDPVISLQVFILRELVNVDKNSYENVHCGIKSHI